MWISDILIKSPAYACCHNINLLFDVIHPYPNHYPLN